MSWFLWGVMFGWGLASLFWYGQSDEDDKTGSSAAILLVGLLIIAIIASISLGVMSGAIPVEGVPTPTPMLGR